MAQRTQPGRDPFIRAGFAWRLRALRRAYGAAHGDPGMTQKDFARELGLEDERYRRYERGEMEPSLGVLASFRRVTGVSLDMLIARERPGSPDMIPAYEGSAATDTILGERLQWVREIYFGDKVQDQAIEMQVDPAIWMRWEAGIVRPQIEKMEEFAHRYSVSLDYLYRGLLNGVRPELAEELLCRHPVLAPPLPDGEGRDPPGNGTATDGDTETPQKRSGSK